MPALIGLAMLIWCIYWFFKWQNERVKNKRARKMRKRQQQQARDARKEGW